MEANELRLGNLVYDKDGNVETVNEISKYGDLYRINELDPDYFSSIPLTDEWLLKFGFTQMKDSSTYEWRDGDYRSVQVDPIPDRTEIYLCGVDSVMSSQCFPVDHVQYVHQLQNLLFALKGKELYLGKN